MNLHELVNNWAWNLSPSEAVKEMLSLKLNEDSVAKEMKKQGYPDNQITAVTGVTIYNDKPCPTCGR